MTWALGGFVCWSELRVTERGLSAPDTNNSGTSSEIITVPGAKLHTKSGSEFERRVGCAMHVGEAGTTNILAGSAVSVFRVNTGMPGKPGGTVAMTNGAYPPPVELPSKKENVTEACPLSRTGTLAEPGVSTGSAVAVTINMARLRTKL